MYCIWLQNVMPYLVATSMSRIRRTNLIVPSATAYTRSAMATVGIQDNTFGCLPHAIQVSFYIQTLHKRGILLTQMWVFALLQTPF